MKKTRLIALILCVVMLLTTLTGCGGKTIMKINGENIPEGIYNYYYSYLYANYSDYYSAEEIGNIAMTQLLQYVTIKDLADELDIEFTALENKEIIDAHNTNIESLGQANYAAMLQAMKLTDKQYAEMGKSSYYFSKIADHFYGTNGVDVPTEEEMLADYKENYIRATHILLSTQNTETDEERAAVKKTAEEVLAKAKAGENFYDLIREYGEDPGVAETPEEGYYFTTGEMVAEFETAAFALEENAISDLVETSYGYHIILRLPMDEETVKETVASDKYYSTYCSAKLDDMMSARAANYEIEYTDAFSEWDPSAAILYWMGY